MNREYYAGVGARSTPSDVQDLMRKIAEHQTKRGKVLRSGGSPGADMAFEEGCGDHPKEIYLPFVGFQDNPSPDYLTDETFGKIKQHPAWSYIAQKLREEDPPVEIDNLPEERQRLFARDIPQVLGRDFNTPSDVVIYWVPEGEVEGTRVTLYVAEYANVPTENLFDAIVYQRWSDEISV